MAEFEFRDRDGVRWRVAWRAAGSEVRTVNGPNGGDTLARLEFTCAAVTFHVPWPSYTDPRAIRGRVLQRMIDRALGG